MISLESTAPTGSEAGHGVVLPKRPGTRLHSAHPGRSMAQVHHEGSRAGGSPGSPVFFKDKGWLRISITSFLSKILEICLGELSIVR